MLIHQAVHRILNVNCSSFSSCQIISWHRCSVALDYLPVWGFLLSQTKQGIKTDTAHRQLPGFPNSQNFINLKGNLAESLLLLFRPTQSKSFMLKWIFWLAESTIIGKLLIFDLHLVSQPLPWTYFSLYLQKVERISCSDTFFRWEKISCKPFNT